jgi:hypothetical protein
MRILVVRAHRSRVLLHALTLLVFLLPFMPKVALLFLVYEYHSIFPFISQIIHCTICKIVLLPMFSDPLLRFRHMCITPSLKLFSITALFTITI